MTPNRSEAPPGAMVEVDINNLKEGRFVEAINKTIKKGLAELMDYQKEAETKGGALTVTATMTIKRAPSTESIWTIKTKVQKKTPTLEQVSDAQQRGPRLLCQPVGTNDDPRQQQFFDANGKPILPDGSPGFIDEATGEVKDSIPMPRAARG